ncbi:MAG: hypothetical protein V8T36_10035 [Ruthenibacterium lactatiformans]
MLVALASAPAALATAEEPPEDLPVAASAQDGAQEETTLPGADAVQPNGAAGWARPTRTRPLPRRCRKTRALQNRSWISRAATRSSIPIDTGDILYEKEPDAEVPMDRSPASTTLLLTLEAVEAGKISMTDIVPISEHAFIHGRQPDWPAAGRAIHSG